MKDYLILFFVFLLFFATINAEASGSAPPTFGYAYIAVVFAAGYLAYKRHKSSYVKSMYIFSLTVQLIFALAIPYWVLNQSMALNAAWPYFPEVLWTTGSLVAFYYVLSFVFLPIVVYLYGRRAWCSFICGTGALTETLGDKYRTRGSKAGGVPGGFTAFRWFVVLVTVIFSVMALTGDPQDKLMSMIFLFFFILFLRTLLLNVANILLMPKLGTRIWCKYFCPQGLILGIISRMGRYALVKDTSLCSGCGTCNQNCSMAVDIKDGPAVNRSGDCVGCGVCVEVCPREALSMTTSAAVIKEKSKGVSLS